MKYEAVISPDKIFVDYDHPHGFLQGVCLADLLLSPSEESRSRIEVSCPRNSAGEKLDWKQLRKRTKKGDLLDSRIHWSAS